MTFTSIICLNAKHTVCNHRQCLFYPFLKFQTGPGGFVLSLLFFLEWLLKGRCWKEESLKSQAEGGSNFLSFVTLSHLIHRKYSRYDWCFFHTVRQYPFISFSSFQFLGGFPSLWFLAAKTKIALARGVKFVGLFAFERPKLQVPTEHGQFLDLQDMSIRRLWLQKSLGHCREGTAWLLTVLLLLAIQYQFQKYRK